MSKRRPSPQGRGPSGKGLPLRPCTTCGSYIGNAAKRCRHCGAGEPSFHRGGYLRVYVPGHPMARADGYALEHRWLLYEMAIPVPDGHHVHHKNGDKADNRWSNLEVIEAREHHRQHIRAAGYVTNQYGTFPVLDPAGRRERTRLRNQARLEYKREWARKKRAPKYDGRIYPPDWDRL